MAHNNCQPQVQWMEENHGIVNATRWDAGATYWDDGDTLWDVGLSDPWIEDCRG